MDHREIEIRFLEIDKEALIQKLRALGATDKGEELLSEIIFYDKENSWQNQNKLVRIRSGKTGTFMTYKHHQTATVDGTHEVEIPVQNIQTARAFLEGIGLVAFRNQEKKRHTFLLKEVVVDIDTWPHIPPFVELEGQSEHALKDCAQKLGLSWETGNTASARDVIENTYGIPVSKLKVYTFSKQY